MPRVDFYRKKKLLISKEEETSSPSEASLISDLGESDVDRTPEGTQKMTLSEKLLKRKKLQVAQGKKQIELI